MASTTIPIPQEIVDTIIDTISRNDEKQRSLKACSLAHRSFVTRSQKHLFMEVILAPIGPPYKWDPQPTGPGLNDLGNRMYTLLQKSPHISQHVRNLKLRVSNHTDFLWLTKNPQLPALFNAFTELKSLELRSTNHLKLSWPKLNNSLQSALVSLLYCGQLDKLVLDGIDSLPSSFVPILSHIRILELSALTFAEDSSELEFESDIQDQARRKNTLQVFSTRDSPFLLRQMSHPRLLAIQPIDFSTLRSLDMEIYSAEVAEHRLKILSDDLFQRTTSLQFLHCIVPYNLNGDSLTDLLTPSRFSRLSRVSFCCVSLAMHHFYDFIQGLPKDKIFNELEIMFSMRHATVDQIIEQISLWNTLDLDIPICKLIIRIFFSEMGDPEDYGDYTEVLYSGLRSRVEGNLLQLINSGKVSIIAHTIKYFGADEFHTEVLSVRQRLIAEGDSKYTFPDI